MSALIEQILGFLPDFYIPRVHWNDVIEIFILAVLLYFFISWILRTRAYTLLRGILIIIVFVFVAYVLGLTTILWIVSRLGSVALFALAIIFQPELRKALESLGNRGMASILPFIDTTNKEQRFSDATITEIIRAVNDMSEVRTGALIVIEQTILLTEYINTGIELDSKVSSQLLVNIFEHNTPLHDGAVIMRGDRVVAATCYLPLSDNVSISKKYGTRHRAGLGISEVSDSFTIIVSEETGRISYAYNGVLTSGVSSSALREQLHLVQHNEIRERSEKKFRIWKGWEKHEE